MDRSFFLPHSVRCPICNSPLSSDGRSLSCSGERRHCYDIAREGYVNLLPPGRAKNSHTGDDADMVRARREFLELGHFARYSEKAALAAAPFLPREELCLIDAGCGEGYHTSNMARTLSEALSVKVNAIGFDASKFAAAAAAKKYAKGSALSDTPHFFAAAGIFRMPVADCSANILTSLFAPLPEEEARRVLRPGGVLLICAADGGHLSELRDVLYDNPIPSGGGAPVPDGFSTVEESLIEYSISLDSREALNALFVMTPFYYNAPREGRARLESLDSLTVTLRVRCTVALKK